MADEVIIVEMRKPSSKEGQMNIFGDIITTQVLDIATLSAAMNTDTAMVQIISKGTGFWYKVGGSSVSAAADTNGNVWLKADASHSISIEGDKYIDTAADA
jgi:hypothetical protein